MRVLFISKGLPDYQCDCLLHGFYNLLGPDLTHTDDYHLMYKEFTSVDILKSISGRGFTMWGNLEKYLNDNSDIESKIRNKYFDYIIYGSFRRNLDYIDLVTSFYPKNRIAIIDGEDDQFINNPYDLPLFKRELLKQSNNTFPISFSIPKEKIVKDEKTIVKEKMLSDYKPSSPGTGYIYDTESEYYKNYQDSFFGLTHKKGGWDCMRHYEILANYCIPYFPDLNNCPELTMFNFPKSDILLSNKLIENEFNNDFYFDILNKLFEYTKNNLTTYESSKYIIECLKKIDK